jgi:hypothetical protein
VARRSARVSSTLLAGGWNIGLRRSRKAKSLGRSRK